MRADQRSEFFTTARAQRKIADKIVPALTPPTLDNVDVEISQTSNERKDGDKFEPHLGTQPSGLPDSSMYVRHQV